MKSTLPLIVICILCGACSESKETRMQRFLMLGNEMITQKNYEKAEQYFKEALRLDSCFADAWNNLGTLSHRNGNQAEALEFYDHAIACNKDLTQAYLNRANIYYELNDVENSLKDLREVEEKRPDTLALHYLKGLVLWKGNRYEEARGSFLKALDKSGDDKDILINIGTLEATLKHYDIARAYLAKALTIAPEEPNAFNALAVTEAEAGNLDVAKEWVERALAKDPKNAYYLNNKGYILLLAGKPEEALSPINESIAADPRNGWAYRNKGLYYLKTNRYDDALRLLKQAETIDPHIEKLNLFLGEAHDKKGDQTAACEHYKRALEKKEITEAEYLQHCK